MNDAAPKAIAISNAVDEVMRRERGRLLAGLIRRLGDFQLAEDALQDAVISALKHWSRVGLPNDPIAWLMKVGLNKGVDRLRAAQRETRKSDDLSGVLSERSAAVDSETIADERLRLIFTCCHPALEEKSRVALTLRTVCNLTTREIAAAFLDAEQTMGQRLSRAKAKIKAKGIGFAVPEPDQWRDRLETVLSAVYLIFTTGYVTEDSGPRDLCKEGVFLSRLLLDLHPNDPEIEGALAFMLLTDARRAARIDENGLMAPIEEQDRALWRSDEITEAQQLLEQAVKRKQPGPFQIKAAIADCHMAPPKPDWPQMSLLYQSLWTFEPTPVVALNWAVVIAETGRADQALKTMMALRDDLEDYQPWHAACAYALQKTGRTDGALAAYERAIDAAPNEAARKFLERRRDQLSQTQR